MKTTRPLPTRRLRPDKAYEVTIIDPGGDTVRVVECETRTQALQVVETEAEQAELWTMFLVSRRKGKMQERVGRWAIGPRGLGRAPARRG